MSFPRWLQALIVRIEACNLAELTSLLHGNASVSHNSQRSLRITVYSELFGALVPRDAD